MFTQDCNFIFVPVDKDFKSLIQDIENSETPFPSELDLKNVEGFLLVPAFLDTKEILFSPWMSSKDFGGMGIRGNIVFTARPENDGMIMMNWDPSKKSQNPLAVGSVEFKKTAEVPGFQQNYAIYLKTGSAFILQKLMEEREWVPERVKDISEDSIRKMGNSYPANKTISRKYWDGLDYVTQELKEMFVACSSSIGYESEGLLKGNLGMEVYEIMLEEFKNDPDYFVQLKFDQPILEKMRYHALSNLENEFLEALNSMNGVSAEKSE
jgi:hypothetical protein